MSVKAATVSAVGVMRVWQSRGRGRGYGDGWLVSGNANEKGNVSVSASAMERALELDWIFYS